MATAHFYRKKYALLLFLAMSALFQAQKKFTIVLDAGHGGSDTGAHRRYEDLGMLNEKDVTLAIVLKLGRMLEKERDMRVIYTRKEDVYPSLTDRTDLANRSRADLFVSVHCNSSGRATELTHSHGTEIYVQGPDQNKTNLEVAKRENEVIFLDAKDKENFSSYNPSSPESLIALKIQQGKYLENSLKFGGLVDDNFINKDHRTSRGVFQKNLHVLRMNAMPSVLIETGFINNIEDSQYLASDKGQEEIAESIYNAVMSYKRLKDKNYAKNNEVQKPAETPMANTFRILLMSAPIKYSTTDPVLKGLANILTIKENGQYSYYYGATNLASERDHILATAKEAGFRNAKAVGFIPNQGMATGYYTLEVAVSSEKLNNRSFLLSTLKDVERNKENGMFYYTYGRYQTLEDAQKAQKGVESKGVANTAIVKVTN